MAKGKYRRLENGFGSVVKLSGNRRRPYAARLSASGTANGQNTPRAIGYYETWQKAYDALAEYNRLHGDCIDSRMTFSDVYRLLIERKKKRPEGLNEGTGRNLQAEYKRSIKLHDRPFAEIRAKDYQALMDELCVNTKSHLLLHTRSLWHQMCRIGEELDIIPKNYASFVTINRADKNEHSETYTEEEISRLWEHSDNDDVARLLVMIYSGFRISEYSVIQTDLTEMTFVGGLKTQSGKQRVVPIHSRIKSLVGRLNGEKGIIPNQRTFRRNLHDILRLCGLEPKNHTPHDSRATFASRLYAAGVPDLHIKRMLGHSTGDLTKDVYTEIFVEELRKSIEKLK